MDLQCEYGAQVASRCPYLPARMLRGYATNWGNILNNLRGEKKNFHSFPHFIFIFRCPYLLASNWKNLNIYWGKKEKKLSHFHTLTHSDLLARMQMCYIVTIVKKRNIFWIRSKTKRERSFLSCCCTSFDKSEAQLSKNQPRKEKYLRERKNIWKLSLFFIKKALLESICLENVMWKSVFF